MKLIPQTIKDMLPSSLLGRSLLILITPLFLVQIITTFIFFDRHWQKMGDRLAFAVAGEISLLATMIEEDPQTQDKASRLKDYAANALDMVAVYKPDEKLERFFYHPKGPLQQTAREGIIGVTLANALKKQVDRPFDIQVDRKKKWVEVHVQLKDGVLIAAVPERRLFSSSGYVVLIWMIGSSMILLVIAVLFMRNQIRPIRRLAIAAERFGTGRDVPFFKIEGAREVRQAARAFIDMRDRIKRQIEQRTIMLAGVSHDLRTPLTRMKLQLEMMPQGPDVDGLKSDLKDMERMMEAYLQFARGQGDEQTQRTNLFDMLTRLAGQINRNGQERVILELEGEPQIVLLRPIAFERCLNNILGNAIAYAGQVWVSARRVGECVELCFDDDGPGIDPSQYEDVFKPFVRGESSRNQKTGGVGLGLPIAQDIVLAHGGKIWLDQSPKGGLRVVIDLPV